MDEEDYQKLVKRCWIKFYDNRDESTCIQILNNLKRIKSMFITWVVERKIRLDQDLKRIEDSLDYFHYQYKEGFSRLVKK